MRKTFRALVGAALVITFAFVSSGVASADTKWKNDCAKITETSNCNIWWSSSSSQAPVVGEVFFHSYGEWVELSDYKTDGKGVYARITYTVGGNTYVDHVYSYSGSDNNYEKVDYDMPEKTLVHIKGCQTDNGILENTCVYANIQA